MTIQVEYSIAQQITQYRQQLEFNRLDLQQLRREIEFTKSEISRHQSILRGEELKEQEASKMFNDDLTALAKLDRRKGEPTREWNQYERRKSGGK